MALVSADVYAQLRPRHSQRRERHPGSRERHALHHQRIGDKRKLNENAMSVSKATNVYSNVRPSYTSLDSAVTDFVRKDAREEQLVQPEVISQYKELTTIDDIRNGMNRTARAKSAPPAHVPDWMLNLDLNLDISHTDVIPPYDDVTEIRTRSRESFTERASFTFIESDTGSETSLHNDAENGLDNFSNNYGDTYVTDKIQNKFGRGIQKENYDPSEYMASRKLGNNKHSALNVNTFKIAQPFSPSRQSPEDSGPRRYQGDKRVLSMQQGGIRSTPMQPTSKKFINQVMTYHHMKHHDKKVRIAKPRIDSQMPATFKIALERKRIVEQRLSSSWSKSSLSSPDPLGSRKSTTPRENTTSRTPSPSGQRRPNERREPSPSGQRRTNERREQSPAVQRRSNERREPSPSGQRKTNVRREQSPSGQRRTHERREQSPSGQRRKTEQREQSPTVNRRTNERGEQSPSGERRTNERLEQSPGDYHWLAAGRRTNNHNYGNP